MHHPAKSSALALALALVSAGCGGGAGGDAATSGSSSYTLVDTGQESCFDDFGAAMSCPATGQRLFGQDAQYSGTAPRYRDNGDGTVSDLNTGLMWVQSPDLNGDGNIDSLDKRTLDAARSAASSYTLAGYDDWRLPTIKELYSLMDFAGATGTALPSSTSVPADAVPYIDTAYFDFAYGDTARGERYIDAQYLSSTEYVSTTMGGNDTMFGVNFADGRIKGYGVSGGGSFTGYVRYVRGNSYGVNRFRDGGDGTIADNATGLTWMQQDSGHLAAGDNGALNWEEALDWCEELSYAGADDWRLPNARELQSIVDYTRSPDTTGSAAINALFEASSITDEAGNTNWPWYWTSTTHQDGPDFAVYIAFGEALGCYDSTTGDAGPGQPVVDVHGAGAQRSDPKTASGTALGCGDGPQGDIIRVYNFARCVRGGV